MARVAYEGRVIEVTDLDVVGPPTKTVEFALSDGSKLLIGLTVTRSWRAHDVFNDAGEPLYAGEMNITRRVRDIPTELYGKPTPKQRVKPHLGPEVA